MKRLSFLTVLALVLLMAISCTKNSGTTSIQPGPGIISLRIASATKDCYGSYAQKCLQVQENGSPKWELFYNPIAGFTYEPGYEYELLVKRETVNNPPADGSSIKYTLVKEVSKTKR